jgi:hypothetical protein
MENFDSIAEPKASEQDVTEEAAEAEDEHEDDEGTFTIENYINLVQTAKRTTIADMLEKGEEDDQITR